MDILTETFDSIFDGLMLGDGNLRKRYKNVQYQQSCKHVSYLNYLKTIMEQFGIYCSNKCPYTYVHKQNKATYSVLVSRIHEYLTENYYRRYPQGVKIVPRDLNLTPDAVRHWYCGDGYLGSTRGRDPEYISMYTNGFSDNDRNLLREKLEEKGWNSSVLNSGQLYIGVNHFLDFLSYMGNCTVPCYQYKWITTSRKEYDKVKLECAGL